MTSAVQERSEQSSRRSSAFESPAIHEWPHIEIWGVLNTTPDSFSDGGEFSTLERAVAQAERLRDEGADVLDVGGASSRPRGITYGAGAEAVSVAEEIRRTAPVLEATRALGIKLSIDTTSADVAAAAIHAGATRVNDVSMGASEALLRLVASTGVELVLMHTRLDGRVIEETTQYQDIVRDVIAELEFAATRARGFGVADAAIWFDPGLGFAKTASQSMELLARTSELVRHGRPLLVGASRKSFLGVMSPAPSGQPAPPRERLGASLAAVCIAANAGARAVRVHDVSASRQAAWITERARPR
jgi:dihydropteroate synthase